MASKIGDGSRFAALQSELARKGVKDPKALAATIGRRKYGKRKFQAMAAKGARRAAMVADTDHDGQ